jgi:hypothetical protein
MNAPQLQHQGKRRQLSTAAAVALGILTSLSCTLQANAQTASGLISTWGRTCKMRVVEQFDVPMSDALVTIGATEKQSIDDGSTSLTDIKKSGMSYNWEIRGKKVSGYCNVNGKGACEATPPALLGSVPRVMSIAENFVKASCEGA